jgi:hypothetical protein
MICRGCQSNREFEIGQSVRNSYRRMFGEESIMPISACRTKKLKRTGLEADLGK